MGVDWWLTDFFCVFNRGGNVGAIAKYYNALTRSCTRRLTSTRSQAALDWLNATMDLHYHAMGGLNPVGPNPTWDDGKALGIMWKETLLKDLPGNDRHENPIPTIVLWEACPIHATRTIDTTSAGMYGSSGVSSHPLPATMALRKSSKRSISGSSGVADPFNRNPKSRRHGPDRGGEETECDVVYLPQAPAVERDSPEKSPTRSGKLRPTGSQMLMPPPPVSDHSKRTSRPLSTGGRVTRSSTRRTADETRGTPTTASTSTSRRGTKRK